VPININLRGKLLSVDRRNNRPAGIWPGNGVGRSWDAGPTLRL